MKKSLALLFVLLAITVSQAANLETTSSVNKPKNIILMISDGCGYNHIDATSLYQYGETGTQIYEKFPVNLGMSTHTFFGRYSPETARQYFVYVDEGPTDSAAATAMSTGVKTYRGAIGVDVDLQSLKNVVEYAEEMGMSTGVVTTVQFSHATPAGFVAHNQSRDNQEEIANEMIYRSGLEVIMGCGAPDYDNNGEEPVESISAEEVGGLATFRDLTDDFQVRGSDADGDGLPDEWTVIRSRYDFQALAQDRRRTGSSGFPWSTKPFSRSAPGMNSPTPTRCPE